MPELNSLRKREKIQNNFPKLILGIQRHNFLCRFCLRTIENNFIVVQLFNNLIFSRFKDGIFYHPIYK